MNMVFWDSFPCHVDAAKTCAVGQYYRWREAGNCYEQVTREPLKSGGGGVENEPLSQSLDIDI